MEPRGSSKLNGGSSKLNGSSFWKSLQRNVKKHMGCFSVVAGRPKDARRALPIKPAGNAKHMGCFSVGAGRPKDSGRALPIKPEGNAVGCCSVRNSEEHEEKLKALILYCRNSYSQGRIQGVADAV